MRCLDLTISGLTPSGRLPYVVRSHRLPSSDPALPVPDFLNPRAQCYALQRSPQVTWAWSNGASQRPSPDHGNIKH